MGFTLYHLPAARSQLLCSDVAEVVTKETLAHDCQGQMRIALVGSWKALVEVSTLQCLLLCCRCGSLSVNKTCTLRSHKNDIVATLCALGLSTSSLCKVFCGMNKLELLLCV